MRKFSPKNYEIVRKIGEGAFGEVHLLESIELPHHKIASKKISAKRKMDRFVDEYKIHKSLFKKGHKNIIGIYGRKSDSKWNFMFLEFADGGDIFDRIDKGMTTISCKHFFKQLMSGLRFIHENGIVHRDIKPENLLIKGKYTLKITDFGAAAPYLDESGKEILLKSLDGTQEYRAPEVKSDKKYRGPPVDIWSSGVTLMIMLTRVQPWDNADNSIPEYQGWIKGKRMHKYPWNRIDRRGIAFLRRIVTEDVDGRATIDEIEKHPWLKGAELIDHENVEDVSEDCNNNKNN